MDERKEEPEEVEGELDSSRWGVIGFNDTPPDEVFVPDGIKITLTEEQLNELGITGKNTPEDSKPDAEKLLEEEGAEDERRGDESQ